MSDNKKQYHIVIVNKKDFTAAVLKSQGLNLDAVFLGLAIDRYNYSEKSTAMLEMFGHFEKCHDELFSSCMVNREIRGTNHEVRIKNCWENCPREILSPEKWLQLQYEKELIVIIGAQGCAVWSNDPRCKSREKPNEL